MGTLTNSSTAAAEEELKESLWFTIIDPAWSLELTGESGEQSSG